jgi:hypothetical protein
MDNSDPESQFDGWAADDDADVEGTGFPDGPARPGQAAHRKTWDDEFYWLRHTIVPAMRPSADLVK